MFVTNWNSTTKIQKISEITNFFRHYFLSRTEVVFVMFYDMQLVTPKEAAMEFTYKLVRRPALRITYKDFRSFL